MTTTTSGTTTTTTTTIVGRKFDTSSISKLDGDNFRVWKVRMSSLFRSHDLNEIVDGTSTRPAAVGDPQKEWDKRNNEAMTSLYLCMTDAEVESISGCATAHEIWNKLNTMYQSISGESKQVLWQKYYSIMVTSGKSPVKTMIEIQNYAAQLRSMGAVIDDEMEVARIISSMMDEKFRQFREAWRSVEIAKQTSALLLSRLKTWELEDGETYKNASHVEETSKAYAAKKERPKRTRQEISDLKKKTKCHICKLKGHWKSECTFKDKDSAKKEQKSDEKSEGAYMAGGLSDLWINDSGANRHYCGRKDWFFEYTEYPCPKSVSMADNSLMLVKGVGAVKVKALINKVWVEITIYQVEYVPGGANLLSENVLLDKGLVVSKSGNNQIIYYRDGQRDIEAERRDGLQIMKFKPIVNRAMACIKPVVWHERLAHINSKFLNDTKDKEAAYGLENMKREDVNFKCEICMKAKSKKKSYVTVEKTVKYLPGECLHSDLGYANAISKNGNSYFLVVKDEASAFRQVNFQKKKGETAMNVIDAINFMRTQTGNNVKMFRSDNGGEYKCQELVSFFSKRGIRFGLNSPQCSPSNGFVEREMRIEQDAARSMLIQSQLHESHWEDAIRTACYVLNRTLSTKNTEKTPYEQVIGKKPTLQHVRIFGSKAFAHITNGQGKKFDDKATECILVGFDAHSKNYILYDPAEGKYHYQAKHVNFIETNASRRESITNDEPDEIITTFSTKEVRNDETEQTDGASETEDEEAETYSSASNSPQQTNPKVHQHNETWADEIQWEASQEDRNFVNTSLPPQPSSSKPKRERQQRKFYQAGSGDANVAMHATNTEPTTYSAALSSKYAGEWKEAMDSEMRSHSENGTWRLVKRPVGKKVLKNRWVYKIKHNPNGEIEKFKARLVVKGFNQVKGVDYTETFAPVSRYETIRTLLSVAAARKLKLVQFDIGTAYLNSELKEEVYMEQAEGYEIGSDMVYILDKTLYGLPQSGRAWFETFSAKLKEMGYVQSKSDKCLFMKTTSTGKIYVVIYVDDGLFAGKNKKELLAEIEKLKASFKVTIQPLVRFLGIEILQVEEGIFLHQTKYIEDLLERFGMQDCITLPIPMQPGLQFDGSECDPNLEFQQLIGSLLFLVRCTRPDIAYATHYLSRFFGSYNKLHMNAAKRILQYLKGTKSLGIMYTESEADRDVVCAYVDADYGSDTTSRKSTSGVLFTHNNSPIVWMSKRQTCISLSSCQAEYVALALAGKEAVWVTRLYLELDMISLENEPICLKTDSQSAIRLAKNDEFHDKSKHIDIRHHFIRDLVETNQVVLEHLPDKVQPADILTKSVVRESFETKRYLMGMVPPPPAKGEKRRALCSVIVNPKRPSLLWSFMALLLSFLTIGATDLHKEGSPVLWRKSYEPVVIGFHAINMRIALISPCEFLPLDDLEPRIANIMKKQCEKAYDEIFLNNLEDICSPPQGRRRQKRVIPVVVGFILVACVGSAGIGLGSYAIAETHRLETRQDELEFAFNKLERQVYEDRQHIKVLKMEIIKVGYQVQQTMNDLNNFKEGVVTIQYLISYLTSKLVEGRKVIWDTKKAWKKKQMTPDLLEYLNFTLPCGDECPVEFGIFHLCQMNKERTQINLDFSVPIVNKNLTKLTADPFFLMLKRDNLTCRMEYSGPTVATLHVGEECVYDTYYEKAHNNIEMTTSNKCRNESSFSNGGKLYKIEKCQISAIGDEKEFVQVKILDSLYHVYCPGGEYLVGKRRVKCPDKVFTLPLSLTFTLNEVEFKGNILRVVYKEREDPLFSELVNWHLNPRVNWSHLSEDLNEIWNTNDERIQKEARNLQVFSFSDDNWTASEITVLILGILFSLVVFLCAIVFLVKKCNMCPKRIQRQAEEQPLKEINGPSNHIIIHT